MKKQVQGWRYALLFVLMFGWSAGLVGCAGRTKVYTAGVQVQETQGMSDVLTETIETPGLPEADDSEEYTGSARGEPESVGEAPELSGGESKSAEEAELLGGESKSTGGFEPSGYVYVCGAVMNPGVYPIHEGMRVFEALELAGGFSQDADREWLNQAELLQDGERLYVYTQEETQAITESLRSDGQADSSILWAENAGSVGSIGEGSIAKAAEDTESAGAQGDAGTDGAGGSQSDGQKVNLNTADRDQLKTLPGIGDAKADAIVQYREAHGAFGSIEEIQNISGIKSGVFSKIRDLITV